MTFYDGENLHLDMSDDDLLQSGNVSANLLPDTSPLLSSTSVVPPGAANVSTSADTTPLLSASGTSTIPPGSTISVSNPASGKQEPPLFFFIEAAPHKHLIWDWKNFSCNAANEKVFIKTTNLRPGIIYNAAIEKYFLVEPDFDPKKDLWLYTNVVDLSSSYKSDLKM